MQWNRKTCRMVLTVMIKTCLSGSQTDGKSNQQTHIMKKMTERQMYSDMKPLRTPSEEALAVLSGTSTTNKPKPERSGGGQETYTCRVIIHASWWMCGMLATFGCSLHFDVETVQIIKLSFDDMKTNLLTLLSPS